jgi:hypothetical protein
MQRNQLGPWAPGGIVDDSRFSLGAADHSPTCRGGVESVEAVGNGQRIRGWIAPPDGEPASRQVGLLGETNRQLGIGLVGIYRPEVRRSGNAASDWTGFVAYIRGPAPSHLRVVLVGQDHKTAICGLQAPSGA